ncbi:hypothetical protein HOH45_05780 [bacterium]|nr:hypothetical protein [bacterium]
MNNKITIKMAVAFAAIFSAASLNASASVDDFNLKGDYRLRYQLEDTESEVSRARTRVRFRLKGERAISEQSTVKFGLATGGTDARSTNQTLQDSFQTPDIRLDFAYISHSLSDDFSVMGGKMKNPLWRSSDLLWDSDINPDGFAVVGNSMIDQFSFSSTFGYFVLDELESDEEDPGLFVLQPRVSFKVSDTMKSTFSLGYYFSQNLVGNTLGNSSESNTGAVSGLVDEFSVIVFSGQLDMTNVMGLPLVRSFGELIVNSAIDASNRGGIVGLKFGDKKVNRFGNWQGKLSYRYLEKDAWLDIFPDADSYGGATNSQGLKVGMNYGLSQAISLGMTYINMDVIDGTKDAQSIFQLDLKSKI